ncbi:hypothetical protein Syun_007685 [Stephania yunnanensis]|uniref:Uncharacterized protein n=1 Tax=Stephania yunnanensis TaxID=152371 RepID=A0AAP0L0X4_9MAGN
MDDDPATTREAMEPVQASNPKKGTPMRSSMEQTTTAMAFQSGGFYMSASCGSYNEPGGDGVWRLSLAIRSTSI